LENTKVEIYYGQVDNEKPVDHKHEKRTLHPILLKNVNHQQPTSNTTQANHNNINSANTPSVDTRKAQLMQRGMCDSDARVKAQCERNLSSQRCFIQTQQRMTPSAISSAMNFSIARHVQCMNSNIA